MRIVRVPLNILRPQRTISFQQRCFSASVRGNFHSPGVRKHRLFSALVVNRPGTLAQVSEAFAEGNDNIQSMSVLPTVAPELSRLTLLCSITERRMAMIRDKLRTLVCVSFLHVTTLDAAHSFAPEDDFLVQINLLIKVLLPKNSPHKCQAFRNLTHRFEADIVHEHSDEKEILIVASLTNKVQQISEFIRSVKSEKLCILELQRSAPVFVHRSLTTLKKENPEGFTRGIPDALNDVSGYNSLVKVPTTATIHSNKRGTGYTPERLRLHARIAHQLYSPPPKQLRRPRFILLIGIPGAGKTSILGHLNSLNRIKLDSFVNFDVDECISMLPEFYHGILNIGLGNKVSDEDDIPERSKLQEEGSTKLNELDPHVRYHICQEEAKFIVKKNKDVAIMNRQNIIYHGSGKSCRKYQNILQHVHSCGYETHVVCVDIDKETAYERVENRSKRYGRNVPKEVIDAADSLISQNFRKLAKQCTNAHLFNSEDRPPRLVWSKQDGEIGISHPEDPCQIKYKL